MKKVLALDISSSTIGWAIFEYDVSSKKYSLLKYGHTKPLSKAKADRAGKGFVCRLNDAYSKISKLIKSECVDEVALEEYAKRYSKGRSSANTIITLATFNEVVTLSCFRELGREPARYTPRTVRTFLGKKFNCKLDEKEDCFKFVDKNFSSFKKTLTRYGNIKTEHYDESDAIIIGLYHILTRF